MNPNPRWSVWAIDMIGGGIVVTCILGLLWLTTVRANHTSRELEKLRNTRTLVHRQLTQKKNECDRKRKLLLRYQSGINKTGKLPDQPPVEDYFQMLSLLATQHHLQVLRHHPINGRAYPGLKEQRFLYEVSGSMPDLTRFFKAIENADYWADISYLKIDQGPRIYRGFFQRTYRPIHHQYVLLIRREQ